MLPATLLRSRYALAVLIGIASAVASGHATAQQSPDKDVDLTVTQPAFTKGAGPRVGIDSAHHNFHTGDNRYWPFAALLRNDGFQVTDFSTPFTATELEKVDVLVISNALDASNENHWAAPTPSAFAADEIAAIKTWVTDGGAILLVADHFPFSGAANDMAKAFGFSFINGFVFDLTHLSEFDRFTQSNGTLRDDVITRGRQQDEAIPALVTFTGSAFQAPTAARPIIVFPSGYIALMPQVAWEFSNTTPRQSAEGYLQGAVMTVGQGRIAVFGDAAMFTAQVTSAPAVRIGFNAPEAVNNKQFTLNVIRWLAGALPQE